MVSTIVPDLKLEASSLGTQKFKKSALNVYY